MKNTNLFYLTLLFSITLANRQPVFADSPHKVETVLGQPRFRLPVPNAADDVKTSKTHSKARDIIVKSHLTRLLSFPSKVLKAKTSSTAVIGMELLTPRTIAITGKSVGKTSIQVFIERFKDDRIGGLQTYTVEVIPSSSGLIMEVKPIGLVPVDAKKISRLLGRAWPDGDQNFEQILIEEIKKRDKRIKELEK